LLLSKAVWISVLGAFLIVSALAVIASQYQSRNIFMKIQQQNQLLVSYEIEWGRLQLEAATLTEENRVERVARRRLNLRIPEREQIIYLKP
jgi:cell division protein FtsL